MTRKAFMTAATVALLALAGLGTARAQGEHPACNNKLIAGHYGFTIEGTKLGGQGPTGPQVGVAMTEFNGNGGLTQIDTVTVNGEVLADFTHPATGSYKVNSDCTGTFSLDFTDGRPPVTANFVVVEDGLEIDTVVTSAGGTQGLIATRSVGKRRFLRR